MKFSVSYGCQVSGLSVTVKLVISQCTYYAPHTDYYNDPPAYVCHGLHASVGLATSLNVDAVAAPTSLQGTHAVSTAAPPRTDTPDPIAHDLCATHADLSSVSENVFGVVPAALQSWHTVSVVVVPALLIPFPFSHVEWGRHTRTLCVTPATPGELAAE